MSNKVSMGGATTWDSWVKKHTSPQNIKTASVKEAAEKKENEEGASSGQLEVEPLHQVGESNHPDEVTEENKKTEISAKKETKVAEKKEEKKDKKDQVTCDCGKVEGELVNAPKAEKDAAADATVKVAEEEKEEKEEKKDDEKKEDKKDDKGEDKDDSGLTEGQKKLPQALQDAIKAKKASGKPMFMKVSNLTDADKKSLKKYYSKFWSQEYINAVIQDK